MFLLTPNLQCLLIKQHVFIQFVTKSVSEEGLHSYTISFQNMPSPTTYIQQCGCVIVCMCVRICVCVNVCVCVYMCILFTGVFLRQKKEPYDSFVKRIWKLSKTSKCIFREVSILQEWQNYIEFGDPLADQNRRFLPEGERVQQSVDHYVQTEKSLLC